jgi:hypothetical protein
LTVVTFHDKRKPDGFQSFEITPHGARVFWIIVGKVVDKLLETPTLGAFQLSQ